MIKVGIIGGTGYTGVELLRLLATHKNVSIDLITSRGEAGKPVADLFPGLRGMVDIAFSEPDIDALKQCDVVFSATPNGVLMQYAKELFEAGVKLIDLAADFRIKDIATWEKWYGMEHACPELVEQAVYGLPELNRAAIQQAAIVANPGCYPTATTLGLLPLVEQGLIDVSDIVVDAKSGVTGAGRGANVATLYSEVNDSLKAYAVSGHRHHPELSQILSTVGGAEVGLTFVPHLVPMQRGMLSTIYVDLLDSTTNVNDVFQERYATEPFVDILPEGALPETRSVRASNYCRISTFKPPVSKKLVIVSVIDNLTKGAAGQAVQNMNIMFDLSENEGLALPAVMP